MPIAGMKFSRHWRRGLAKILGFVDARDDSGLGSAVYATREWRALAMVDYPFGTPLRFRARRRDIYRADPSDELIEWKGHVNGDTVMLDNGRYVAVWCDRVGKEGTTIFVAERNILTQGRMSDSFLTTSTVTDLGDQLDVAESGAASD